MNKLYTDLIHVKVEAALAGVEAAKYFNHQGLKGELCEIVTRDLLRPLLPSDIALGTGVIVTADNQQSPQQDVVLIDRSIAPPVFLEGTTGIFPIEAALFAIEIKKKLDAGELERSIKNASKLASMSTSLLPGNVDDNDNQITTDQYHPVSAILAFTSDLPQGGKDELNRFNEKWDQSTGEPPIKLICVVGRGCWFWSQSAWVPRPTNNRAQAVITFIAVIMNSYKKIGRSRGAPRMGNYILEP